jgi:hypothetical protein
VNAFIPFGAAALGVILYTLFHPSLRRQSDDPDAPPGEAPPGPSTSKLPGRRPFQRDAPVPRLPRTSVGNSSSGDSPADRPATQPVAGPGSVTGR